MKKNQIFFLFFGFHFVLTLIISGGGGEYGAGDIGGGGVTVNPPANNKTCETGTSVSSTQSDVDFTMGVSGDTDSYDLKITYLNSNDATNKSGLTTTSTKVALDKRSVLYKTFFRDQKRRSFNGL